MDNYFMKRAIEISLNGTETGPNPRVGCVVVRNGKIIGEGFHACCGGAHAERAAFDAVRENGTSPRGATVYVTLEPCSHFGRTPPCAPMLAEAGVERVVVGMSDPNPKVGGRGIEILKNAGVKVDLICGQLEAECKWINRGFIRHHTLGRPWVTLKMAVSLDGMLALADGTSKWLTGAEARSVAHEMRAEHDGILVGVGTILADDPELTVRLVEGKSPRRVILDSNLRTPPAAKAARDAIIFCENPPYPPLARGGEEPTRGFTPLAKGGMPEGQGGFSAEVVPMPTVDGKIDLKAALAYLAETGIQRLLVEGGGAVHSSFLEGGFADAVAVFVAPLFLGAGIGATRGLRVANMADAERFALEETKIRPVGKDILIEGRFKNAPML